MTTPPVIRIRDLHTRFGRNVIHRMHEWEIYEGLGTQLACNVAPFDLPAHYNRKTMRSMGRVAVMATRATEIALPADVLQAIDAMETGERRGEHPEKMGTGYHATTPKP